MDEFRPMGDLGEITANQPQPDFVRTQLAFARHIRDPQHSPAPAEVEDRRMAIYRELVFNNVSSLLATSFPVTRKLLPDELWRDMIRDFLIKHRCRTPLFLELAQEFLDYLGKKREPDSADPPFLLELAHYEWVELALGISDDDSAPHLADPNGDLMNGVPMVSPLAWNLSYRFPVHRIGPDFQPAEPSPQPTHLVVYRNRQDRVEFLEINAVTQRLLQLLQENPPRTGLQTLTAIGEELEHPDPAQVVAAGQQLMLDLRARQVIVGTRYQTPPGGSRRPLPEGQTRSIKRPPASRHQG
ncbi:MAG: putative DNA-binding domain-containing protein [Thiohalocapsa sp.]